MNTKHRIVFASTSSVFEKELNKWCSQGWKLAGFTVISGECAGYYAVLQKSKP